MGSFQGPDLEVAQLERTRMVALEADDPALRLGEVRIGPELRLRHHRVPLWRPDLVFEGLLPIHPMLNVRAPRDDLRRVPDAADVRDVPRRHVEAVRGASEVRRILVV